MHAPETGQPDRAPLQDRIGRLCNAGKDLASYLYQVPSDEAQRQKLREVLAAILKETATSQRRELPKIAQDMQDALDQPPSPATAELLMDGFDRMTRLWQAARSGLF